MIAIRYQLQLLHSFCSIFPFPPVQNIMQDLRLVTEQRKQGMKLCGKWMELLHWKYFK